MKKKLTSTKNWFEHHKVALAVVATSAVWFHVNQRALMRHNEFLVEKKLYEEFYTPS